jgi:hypothetical protein
MDVVQEPEVGRVVVTIRVILLAKEEETEEMEIEVAEIEDEEVEVLEATAMIVASAADLPEQGKGAREDIRTADNFVR